MPLKLWLPSKSNIPLIGGLLQEEWVAYFFSWFGAIYDLSIPFLLFVRRTRWVAYFLVIVFHMATYFLFQIGMFPFIMIGATLIFFSEKFHVSIIHWIKKKTRSRLQHTFIHWQPKIHVKWNLILFGLFFILQLTIPFRYILYPGNLYWTEQGYRFSWRVMLMEKAGYAIFHVTNPENGRTWEVNNYDFLTSNQKKMMSTQPDMILQFAHLLEQHYQREGVLQPKITAEVYVTLNGKQSQLFIDPTVDLTQIKDSFAAKKWILPFESNAND